MEAETAALAAEERAKALAHAQFADDASDLYVGTIHSTMVSFGSAGLLPDHVSHLWQSARRVALMLPTMGPVGALIMSTGVAVGVGMSVKPNAQNRIKPLEPAEVIKLSRTGYAGLYAVPQQPQPQPATVLPFEPSKGGAP